MVRLSLFERFNCLMEGLSGCVASEAQFRLVEVRLIGMLFRRLWRLKRRFGAIMERLRAGTLGQARPRLARGRSAAPSVVWVLPQQTGWLLRIDRTVIPGYALEELVDDPALATLVAEAPELGSVLRPLCKMLAVKMPAWLRLPRKPRPVVAKFAPAPEWLVAEPGAILKPDGTVWMRYGASRSWNPRCGYTLEEAQKYDYPIKIWPRED